jgi:hypothetical protein
LANYFHHDSADERQQLSVMAVSAARKTLEHLRALAEGLGHEPLGKSAK